MPVAWKLKEVLERHDLSVYALAEQMGGMSGAASKRPGLYAITSPDPAKRPTRVSFELLSELLTALGELTGREHTISDVLEFTPDRPGTPLWTEQGRSLGGVGILDDLLDQADPVPGAADGRQPEDIQTETPRRRGRPKGSRNRKKATEQG